MRKQSYLFTYPYYNDFVCDISVQTRCFDDQVSYYQVKTYKYIIAAMLFAEFPGSDEDYLFCRG